MCSGLCPCDLDRTEITIQAEWIALLNDETKLAEFDRCLLTNPDCDSDKAVIYTLEGVSEINAILDASGFELQSYQTF